MSNTMAEPFCEEHLIGTRRRLHRLARRRHLHRLAPDEPGRRHQPVPAARGGPPADRHRVPGPVVDRPTRTHGRRPAHRGNQGGRTPHPGPHPPDAGGPAGRPGLRGRIQSFRHYVRSQLLQQKVQTAPARALSFLSVQHPFSPPPQGFLIPVRRPKMASDQKVQAFRPNRGYFP